MTVNDYSGSIELMFWKENYVHFGDYIQEAQKLMLTGIYDENRFRPGQMEFKVQSVMLLGDVKTKLTKRISLAFPLQKLDHDFVSFLQQNIQQHPGGCELNFQIFDEENERSAILRSNNGRLHVNDDLIEYLQTADIKYKVEVS